MAESARDPAVKAHDSLKAVQAFQQNVEDHRFLSEYLANVRRSTAVLNEQKPLQRITAIKAFLAEHVIGHFAFEERHVFPQLLARETAAATRQAVLELIDEHRAMKVDVSRLRRKMRSVRASGTPQALARLEAAFRDFLVVLQAHAVKEDNILLAVKQARRREAPLP